MTKSKKFSLENHIKRLKKIVDEMQSGKPDFDENIQLFEEGSKLIRESKKHLDESELLIKQLIEKEDGIEEEDLDI